MGKWLSENSDDRRNRTETIDNNGNGRHTYRNLFEHDEQHWSLPQAVALQQQRQVLQQEDCREVADEDWRVALGFDHGDEPYSLKADSSHAFPLRSSCMALGHSHKRILSCPCDNARKHRQP